MAVALDSDVVIGFLDAGDARHRAADAGIRDLMRRHSFVVSAVTYAEVLTGARLGRHDEGRVGDFFAKLISEVIPVDTKVADVAAGFRAAHRALRMPDALILATASAHPHIDLVLSGDAGAAKVRGLDCKVCLLT